ncbi:MAG: hypothetical protein ACXAC7_11325 [Candidatus Hodarchaeales archaeon]
MSNTNEPVPPPAFRGQIRIPVRLQKWQPKKKYTKKHFASLRVDSIDYEVGVAPFKIKAEMLGHYFEAHKDIYIELIVTIDAWLMSPELLDTARLDFSLTLIGEENNTKQSFYASLNDNDRQKPQLPIWTRTHANWNVKFKLSYDLSEFERNVTATLRWHHERINWFQQQIKFLDLNNLAQKDPAGFAYLQKVLPKDGTNTPEILSPVLLEQLEQARYITPGLKKLVQSYQKTLQAFLDLNENIQLIINSKQDKIYLHHAQQQQNILSRRLQNRLDVFQKVIKTYEEIKLEKLGSFLNIDRKELEAWLLSIVDKFPCFRIRDNKLIIQHDAVDPVLLEQLDQKFLEWELFERHAKPAF